MPGILLFLLLLSISDGNAEINCPQSCPDDYKPVCAHGISYKNKCVLLQQICNKKLDEKMVSEIEACPSYDTQAEAKDKSVEAIDKNGVIFRSNFDVANDEDLEESTMLKYL